MKKVQVRYGTGQLSQYLILAALRQPAVQAFIIEDVHGSSWLSLLVCWAPNVRCLTGLVHFWYIGNTNYRIYCGNYFQCISFADIVRPAGKINFPQANAGQERTWHGMTKEGGQRRAALPYGVLNVALGVDDA